MTELNIESLKEQTRNLPDSEAAEILDTALRQVAATSEFYIGSNSHIVISVLMMLAHRDLDRADAALSFAYRMHERPYVNWIRESVHRDVRTTRRRQVLEALTQEEREAQLVLASLMPGGKPQDEVEQAALVMAVLKDDPSRACALAAHWWNGSFFDDSLEELMEVCWQSHPDELRALLSHWHGSRRETVTRIWVERLLIAQDDWSKSQIISLLELMQGANYIDRELLFQVLNALASWTEEARRIALLAMMPLWERLFPHLFSSRGVSGVDVFLRLWEYDSSVENRGWLDRLLVSRESQDRLSDARQIKRALKAEGQVGRYFGTTVHASAILCRRGKKLRDYLNRKYVRPDHRRLWRSFLRGGRLIRTVPDEVLRTRLLGEYEVIARETRRARKGAILAALETETDEPIRVAPEKGNKK